MYCNLLCYIAMLLCQQGRCEAAQPYLASDGFTWRLSRQVFHYPVGICNHDSSTSDADGGSGGNADDGDDGNSYGGDGDSRSDKNRGNKNGDDINNTIVNVVDDAMSDDIITTLQHIFRPTSPYWLEHNYDIVLSASSTVGYYSYLYPMKAQSYQPKCFIEQVKHIVTVHDQLYRMICLSL